MARLRVVLIAPPWVPVPPPAYGGSETVIDELARGLVAAGHEVRLIATGDSTCPVPTSWVYPESDDTTMGNAAHELRHVLYAYEQVGDVDIVHDHTLIGPLFAAGRAGDLPPVVTTNHGPFNAELGALYRAVCDDVGVIAISRHQASMASGVRIAAVIHHGIDPAGYGPGDGTGGYCVFLGRMAESKGVDIAARAARAAGVPLLIAAKMREPAEREYFASQVRPLLGHDVVYLGEVGRREKLRLLAGAVALVNPIGWDEPFGMVMIEALACATPVLAFPRGAAPEIVDHGRTGYLCTGEDDLADKLGRVGELSRRACRRAAVIRFSASRMVDEHVAVYEQAIRRHARRATGAPDLPARSVALSIA